MVRSFITRIEFEDRSSGDRAGESAHWAIQTILRVLVPIFRQCAPRSAIVGASAWNAVGRIDRSGLGPCTVRTRCTINTIPERAVGIFWTALAPLSHEYKPTTRRTVSTLECAIA